LRAFALGIPGYVLVKALTPGFFAREDTATPVKVAAVCLGVTVVLNVALMIPFKHVGIALATAITAWVNAGLLGLLLRRRGHFALDARLKARLPRILAATLAMAAAVGLARWGAGAWLDGPLGLRAAGLALLIALGLGVFGLAAQATGAATLAEVRKALGRKAA
jgi:putative peptidoglycan lipid II flippase